MKIDEMSAFKDLMNNTKEIIDQRMIGRYYKADFNKKILRIYWEKFAGYTWQQVFDAFDVHLLNTNNKFFPSIGEIIGNIQNQKLETGELEKLKKKKEIFAQEKNNNKEQKEGPKLLRRSLSEDTEIMKEWRKNNPEFEASKGET